MIMSLNSNINYRNIFILSILLWLSQQFYAITVPLIIYQQTQSALSMGIARAMEFLPNILIAPVIGYLVDRFHAKKMLLVSLLGQFISLITIYVFFRHYSNGSLRIQHYMYFTIVIFMAFNMIFNNIRNVLIKSSIPTELLTAANSYLQSAAQIIQVCGPVLGGLILLFSDLLNGILICIGCLFVSIMLFIRISFSDVKSKSVDKKFNLDSVVFEPIKMVIQNKPLKHFTILAMIINVAEGISGIMYIYFFKSVLLLNSAVVGIFFSVMGIGAVIGGLISPILRKKFEDLRVINTLLLALTTLYFLMGFITSPLIIVILIFFQGTASMITAVYIWSIRQEKVKIKDMGRIVGITSAIFKLGMPISIVAAGFFVSNYSSNYAFYVCAMVCVIAYVVNMRYKLKKTHSA